MSPSSFSPKQCVGCLNLRLGALSLLLLYIFFLLIRYKRSPLGTIKIRVNCLFSVLLSHINSDCMLNPATHQTHEGFAMMTFMCVTKKKKTRLTPLTTTAGPWAAYGWLLWQSFSGCRAAAGGWWFAESSKLCREEAWLQPTNKQTTHNKQGASAQLCRWWIGKDGEILKVINADFKTSKNYEIRLGTPENMYRLFIGLKWEFWH